LEEEMAEERHEFKAEIQQLLQILVHSLYTDREIFVRELISNAVDALNRVQFEMLTNRDVLDSDAELAIRLSADEEARTITISDSGIGMTREELVRNLGTIAQSGAAGFLKQLEQSAVDGEGDQPAIEMIGQFGVGFYSAFMVAGEVRVVSRSYLPGAEACEWISDGSASFRVGPADKADRGTEVTVVLREDAAEFASDWRLEQIARRHSDFVAFPVHVGERVVNRQKPLWRQSPREISDEYNEFYKHLTLDFEDPLLVSHLVTDAPVDIRSILCVPSRRDRGPLDPRSDYGLRLYAKGVLIQEHHKDLLPNYLRFVEGVVESEDLPLNVSRETVQRNPAVRRIQKALVGKLLRELEDLNETAPDDYRRFWTQFGPFLKEGVAADPTSKDDLLPLLRFHSSKAEGKGVTSLAEYIDRMGDEQPAIYYHLGEDLGALAQSPHLDYFNAHDIEVLYLVDPVDPFMVMTLSEYDGKPLRNVDDASLELPEEDKEERPEQETIPESDFGQLVARFVTVLGDRVTQVRESKVLHDSPCRLVSPEDAPGTGIQRVYKVLNQEYEVPKKILEINRRNLLIGNLAHLISETPLEPIIDVTIEQLYENQLLVEGLHPNPAAMIPHVQALMEAATRRPVSISDAEGDDQEADAA
jgi:molecular chaperone HtpG